MTSVRTRYVTTTLLMLAAAALAVVLQGRDERPAPRLDADRLRASRPPAPAPLLTAAALLERRTDLALVPAQVARLEDADRRWHAEIAGLGAAVERAGAELARFVETAGARASVDELQHRSAEYRELSGELRSRRLRHAEAAQSMLTDTQRSMLARAPSPGRRGETP